MLLEYSVKNLYEFVLKIVFTVHTNMLYLMCAGIKTALCKLSWCTIQQKQNENSLTTSRSLCRISLTFRPIYLTLIYKMKPH